MMVVSSGITPSSNNWSNVYPSQLLAGNDLWCWVDVQFVAGATGPFVHGVTVQIKARLVDATGATVIPDTPDDLVLTDIDGSGFISATPGSTANATPVLGVSTWSGVFTAAGSFHFSVDTTWNRYPGNLTIPLTPFPGCNNTRNPGLATVSVT
jgi:hypothetical protein